jgi:hypothetical protein
MGRSLGLSEIGEHEERNVLLYSDRTCGLKVTEPFSALLHSLGSVFFSSTMNKCFALF